MRNAVLLVACVGLVTYFGITIARGSRRTQPGAQRPTGVEKKEPAAPAPSEATGEDLSAPHWALIEGAIPQAGPATDEHIGAITDQLRKLPAEQIVAFDRFLDEQLARAYRWDLWAVGYIVMGGCGDDGFEYFRLWIIAHGREYYEQALKDPVRAADALEPGDEADCESLRYAAAEAHEDATGRPLPPPPSARRPSEPQGTPWKEEEVAALYPDLAKRFR